MQPTRPRPRRGRSAPLVLALAVVFVLAACAADETGVAAGDGSTTTAAPPREYSNAVDGVSVKWPGGWHRATEPLDRGRLSGSVELLALTTFPDPPRGQCAPPPDAAMAAMKDGDVVLTLRTFEGPNDGTTLAPRPPKLMTAAQPVPEAAASRGDRPPGDCYPTGVGAWQLSFHEHGRRYDVFVAAHSPLDDERRAQIEEIWANLVLTPIATGHPEAEAGRPYWHALYTHCGIRGTTFDGREWRVTAPSPDGEANPPAGWNNPGEIGVIVLEDESTAVFTSRDGERRASFRPRTSADPDLALCM